MSYGSQLRSLIESESILVSPGVHDPLSARVADDVGFDLVSMTGNGTSLSKGGQPDVGVITLLEMVENATRIQETVDIPVIADAENGFGNAINVIRAIEEFVRAGVAAIHIEDQVFPKRCGFVEGKQVISKEEAVGKFRAATDVREELNSEMIIIARTDVRSAPDGSLTDAIDRVNGYCKAGADVAFVQGAESAEELERVAAEVSSPLLYNCSGESPIISIDYAAELGYDIVMFPRISMLPTIQTLFERFEKLQEEGIEAWTETKESFADAPIESYDDFAGIPEILEWEDEYLPET